MRFDQRAFRKGVNDALTLAPLREVWSAGSEIVIKRFTVMFRRLFLWALSLRKTRHQVDPAQMQRIEALERSVRVLDARLRDIERDFRYLERLQSDNVRWFGDGDRNRPIGGLRGPECA